MCGSGKNKTSPSPNNIDHATAAQQETKEEIENMRRRSGEKKEENKLKRTQQFRPNETGRLCRSCPHGERPKEYGPKRTSELETTKKKAAHLFCVQFNGLEQDSTEKTISQDSQQ